MNSYFSALPMDLITLLFTDYFTSVEIVGNFDKISRVIPFSKKLAETLWKRDISSERIPDNLTMNNYTYVIDAFNHLTDQYAKRHFVYTNDYDQLLKLHYYLVLCSDEWTFRDIMVNNSIGVLRFILLIGDTYIHRCLFRSAALHGNIRLAKIIYEYLGSGKIEVSDLNNLLLLENVINLNVEMVKYLIDCGVNDFREAISCVSNPRIFLVEDLDKREQILKLLQEAAYKVNLTIDTDH